MSKDISKMPSPALPLGNWCLCTGLEHCKNCTVEPTYTELNPKRLKTKTAKISSAIIERKTGSAKDGTKY